MVHTVALPAMVALGRSGTVIICTTVSVKQPGVVTLVWRTRFTPGVAKVCVKVLNGVALAVVVPPVYTVVILVTGSYASHHIL